MIRKEEIAWNKQCLLFLQCFLLYMTLFFILNALKKSSAICFNLDQSKIFSSGNGLNLVDWVTGNLLKLVEKVYSPFQTMTASEAI